MTDTQHEHSQHPYHQPSPQQTETHLKELFSEEERATTRASSRGRSR